MDGITSALIVREPYISKILDGQKTWEMRSRATERRGPIGLIGKGTGKVVGVVRLVDVLDEQTESQMYTNQERHLMPLEELARPEVAKWRTPWVMTGALRLPHPVPYGHRSGAVTWVTLVPEVISAIEEQVPGGWLTASLAAMTRADNERQVEVAAIEFESKEAGTIVSAIPRRNDLVEVPFAKDGSCFGPHLKAGNRRFVVGEKDEPRYFDDFGEALAYLRTMKIAKWRRPNSVGNWGLVSAVEWKPTRLTEFES